jgi:predicted kinase
MVMKQLILLRGLPGSGKSTLAKSLGGIHIEADQYFMDKGVYKFDASQLKNAHNYCQTQTGAWMSHNGEQVSADKIIVSNTFTQEWEMVPYFQMAKEFGYQVICLIVENRHGSDSIHGVPEDKIQQMRSRFEVKL